MPKPTARDHWFEDCALLRCRKLVRDRCFFGKEELDGLGGVVGMADKHCANQRSCQQNLTMIQASKMRRRTTALVFAQGEG